MGTTVGLAAKSDTSLEVEQVRAKGLRASGIERRARMTFDMCDSLRSRISAGIRHRHPEYEEETVRLATARILLGDELFRLVYASAEAQP